ncbi:MAG: cupredoxin domain-containing protein [Thaumarchaeota archaeon]|nr:cupredoxin domain-containing protein [Nitrososphaerota archaeon]
MLKQKSFDKKMIAISLTASMFLLIFIVVFVGQGNVRHVIIFWDEDIRTTVAFRSENSTTHVVGLVGNGGVDPTLVMKAGHTPYILTVINQDTVPHMFFVSGLNAHTKLLRPGENDTITLVSKNESEYNYYDRMQPDKIIGKIIAVKVERFD